MSKNTTEKTVERMVEDLLKTDTDMFLVGVSLQGKVGRQKLLVEIDSDMGLSVEQCAKTGKALAAKLKDRKPIAGKFNLEVASPGADRPIRNIRQYAKHVGREMNIQTSAGTVRGVFKGLQDNTVRLSGNHDEAVREIPLSDIKKSTVILSFK